GRGCKGTLGQGWNRAQGQRWNRAQARTRHLEAAARAAGLAAGDSPGAGPAATAAQRPGSPRRGPPTPGQGPGEAPARPRAGPAQVAQRGRHDRRHDPVSATLRAPRAPAPPHAGANQARAPAPRGSAAGGQWARAAGGGGQAAPPSTRGRSLARSLPQTLVDHERIRDVGPDRAASEWLLRCGAMVRYQGQERWQKDYNHLPTGPLDKYKIQAIDATDSCIMNIGFDHMEGLRHVEKIRLCKCHYIEDACLERLSQLENLQKSVLEMEIISCGNVTDKGVAALHRLRNLKYLLLSDLPGIREKENLVQVFKTTLPSLELKLDLK
uniref:Distal membrane arm assembly component 2 like n=1 Tax=Equus caballus TaxID=9796 RepID=A0A9L0S894_HORSE